MVFGKLTVLKALLKSNNASIVNCMHFIPSRMSSVIFIATVALLCERIQESILDKKITELLITLEWNSNIRFDFFGNVIVWAYFHLAGQILEVTEFLSM